ncbi:hypothetical protein TPHA_0K01790 [Tetrapisispora phaffii CBS 4417]|uniref:Uncharacterized protein n=1 Tax=Tetrapisispora phaffii (strain ATCC 24235 / CBS 4417 / NBRC 1672 / NRRL Y-8282 / UCD 70-5) TaxID=1071381 RepID=G8BZI4_TETPH|nr:hypothetical protein TPHA_0K01790 [Tetrapisispora phaffii CBS 4417]CCE65312.1 hypothetical protein TPHA_0K01790 [Tetrapisispora phaffii CBS 4417]
MTISLHDELNNDLILFLQKINSISNKKIVNQKKVKFQLEKICFNLINFFNKLDYTYDLNLFNDLKLKLNLNNSNLLTLLFKYEIDLNLISILCFILQLLKIKFLIVDTINDWKDNINYNSDNVAAEEGEEILSLFNIISVFSRFDKIDQEILNYYEIDLRNSFINYLLPNWLNHKTRDNEIESKNIWDNLSDHSIIKSENKFSFYSNLINLDYFILNYITIGNINEIIELKLNSNENNFYLFDLLLQQIFINSKYLSNDIKLIINHYFINDKNDEKNIVEFNLKVLMEVIDHPELNYLEETKLLILLNNSIKTINNNFNCKIIHDSLNNTGTTKTFFAILNLLQYQISKYLINITNLAYQSSSSSSLDNKIQHLNSNLTTYQIPAWYEKQIIPSIPPISKSLFIFDKKRNNTEINKIEKDSILNNLNLNLKKNHNYFQNIVLLLDSLSIIISTNIKLLKQYGILKISILQTTSSLSNEVSTLNESIENELDQNSEEIKYKITQVYFQQYYIPIMTTLIQCKSFSESNILTTSTKLLNKLVFTNILKLIEQLTEYHGNLALYHLLKFVSKTSVDDLIIQRISIELLNHLFFHNSQGEENVIENRNKDIILQNNYIFKLCLENELSMRTLRNYIKLWNDGKQIYKLFFTELFDMDQPNVEYEKIRLTDLLEYLPNLNKYSVSQETETLLKSELNSNASATNYDNYNSNNNSNNNNNNNNNNGNEKKKTNSIQSNQSRNNLEKSKSNNMTQLLPPHSNKYNAYSASSFIPSTNNIENEIVYDNNSNSGNNESMSYFYNNQTMTPTAQDINMEYNLYSNKSLMNSSKILNNDISIGNNTLNTEISSYSNTPYTDRILSIGQSMNSSMNVPSTPVTNSSTIGSASISGTFASPWQEHSGMSMNFNSSRVVNTGKNYILGGHNKVKNNSRAQSIHIDQFENTQHEQR